MFSPTKLSLISALLLGSTSLVQVQVQAAENVTCPDGLFDALKSISSSLSDPSILHLNGDSGFGDSFELYNLHVPLTPCAVIRPKNTNDVSVALKAIHELSESSKDDNSTTPIHVQARSGGHSYANHGLGGTDGAVVIWLEDLSGFSIDKESWEATVGSGNLLGTLSEKLAGDGNNRTTPHGTCPQVGVGGHATIGGLGPLSRQHGPLLDQVVDMEVVTADGSVVRANERENEDLFFALRGAGGSFGVITEFVIKTYPLDEAVQYSYTFKLGKHADMVDTFEAWQNYIAKEDTDRRLASLAIMSIDSMIITGTFFGTISEFDSLGFEAALSDGKAPDESTRELRTGLGIIEHWFEEAALQIGGGIPSQFYAKDLTVKVGQTISREAIEKWFKFLDETESGTELWFAIADFQSGATNDVPMDATAYAHRDDLWMLQSYAVAPLIGIGFNDQIIKFLTGMNEAITSSMPDSEFGAYPGYVDPMLSKEEANRQYWGSNYNRLVEIKEKWDPNNIFANPQSVGKGW